MNTDSTFSGSGCNQVVQSIIPQKRPPKTNAVPFARQVLQLILVAGLCIASYFFVSHFVLQSVEVVGVSMSPTLRDTDHYFLNRWVYLLHHPKRDDIVVVKDPSDGMLVVKRIVAMPGESIYFQHGKVFVNGRELSEPYLPPGTRTYANANVGEELIMCGKDQFYVLGDNRGNSYDSRMYGPVQFHSILGEVTP